MKVCIYRLEYDTMVSHADWEFRLNKTANCRFTLSAHLVSLDGGPVAPSARRGLKDAFDLFGALRDMMSDLLDSDRRFLTLDFGQIAVAIAAVDGKLARDFRGAASICLQGGGNGRKSGADPIQFATDPSTGGEFGGDGMCACPVCGAAYLPWEQTCDHMLHDACFTADYGPGEHKGAWPTADGHEVIMEAERACERLRCLVEEEEWPSEERLERFTASLPDTVRNAIDSPATFASGYEDTAPGYLGCTEVITDSMASDAWSVHWARDKFVAARDIEKRVAADAKEVVRAVARAERILRIPRTAANA